MRRLVTVSMILFSAATLAIGGCANTQPGDKNAGPGVAQERPDVTVKLAALRGDPCRGPRVATIYPGCGRFVTEVANTVATLRAQLPGEVVATSALNDAVTVYQRLGCEIVAGAASPDQTTRCPQALTTIGAELDRLGRVMASQPTG